MTDNSNDFATGYAVGRDSTNGGGYNNGGMFGGNNDWGWIIILLLFGWNGRGFGGFGGGYGGGFGGFGGSGVGENYVLATDFATIERKLDGVNSGLCDGFYAQNTNMLNGFAGVQQTLCQGFSGVNSSISNLGYQNAQHASNISAQLAQCCCDTRAAIKDVNIGIERTGWNVSKQISDCCCDIEKMNMQNRFDAQAYNCNTLQAIDKLGDRIENRLAAMDAERIREQLDAERTRNAILQGQIDRAQLRFDIVNDVKPCPSPAYFVPNPNCCYNANVTYSNACGCNGGF